MFSQKIADMVDRATSNDLRQPDMNTNNQIKDEINQNSDLQAPSFVSQSLSSGKTAAYQIRKRVLTNEPKVMFLSLGLLDMLMDKCATSFHAQVGTKDFMQVLIVILNNKAMQPEILKKIVYLIQKWGLRFEKEQREKLPLYFDVYSALKKNGVQFPPPTQVQPQAQVRPPPVVAKQPAASTKQSGAKDIDHLPRKYQKLIGDMNLVKGNINLTNEIIDGMRAGEKNETLNDLFNTLTSMEPKLFTLIGQIENEEVMTVCLLVNDDLQKTFKRYHAIKDGRKPESFVPGESVKNTVLSPTHIYTKGSASSPAVVQSQPKPKPQEPMADLFDFGPPKQSQPQPIVQPQQQKQEAQPQKPLDPISQLNEIMARMSVQPQPGAQAGQQPNPMAGYMTNQSMVNPQGFQPQPQMGMPQNTYQTSQQPMGQQMMMDAFGVSGGNQGNYSKPQQQQQMGYNQNSFSTQGPSNQSWKKDNFDMMGNNVKSSQNQMHRDRDNVKEFQDLFSLADKKIATTAQKKQQVDYTYNPLGMNAAGQQQPAPQQQMQAQPVPKPVAQPAPQNDFFAQPVAQAPQNDFFAQPAPQSAPQKDFFAQPVAQAAPQNDFFAQAAPQNDFFSQPASQNNSSFDQQQNQSQNSQNEMFSEPEPATNQQQQQWDFSSEPVAQTASPQNDMFAQPAQVQQQNDFFAAEQELYTSNEQPKSNNSGAPFDIMGMVNQAAAMPERQPDQQYSQQQQSAFDFEQNQSNSDDIFAMPPSSGQIYAQPQAPSSTAGGNQEFNNLFSD